MRILVVIALLLVSPAVRSDIVTIGGLNNSPSLPTSGRQAFGGNGSVNTYGIAQSFQFSQDFRITNLKANLFMTSIGPGYFRVNLYSGNSRPQNLISILSYDSFRNIGQTANSYISVSPIENITVTANQKYWIAVQLDDPYYSSAKKWAFNDTNQFNNNQSYSDWAVASGFDYLNTSWTVQPTASNHQMGLLITGETTAVPEPGTLILTATTLAVAAIGVYINRRRKSRKELAI